MRHFIARERGIRVVESRSNRPSDFLNSSDREASPARQVPTRSKARCSATKPCVSCGVNAFHLEAVPEGYILVIHNHDVPGVVGAMGTLLGQARD